jgi:hypothetical protein
MIRELSKIAAMVRGSAFVVRAPPIPNATQPYNVNKTNR